VSKPPVSDNFGQQMAQGLDAVFNGSERPRKVGFALFWFEFNKIDGGQVNYVSNAARADMLVAVREWLARAEGRVTATEAKQ
jgi:hypothetical protein